MKTELNLTSLGVSLAIALFATGSSVAVAQDSAQIAADNENDSSEIEQIVVTGSRLEQNIEDVAGSISVMTSEDIEQQLITDMSQMFRYEPGVHITGSNGNAQNVIVRGMGGDRVMMIKDGMRMNEGYGANGLNDVVGRGFVDMDTIKQVEVAKGATSSLYGADAMGGVVAFATKDARDFLRGEDFHAAANIDHDGRNSSNGAGVLSAFRLGRLETLVSYKNRRSNEDRNYSDEREHADIDSDSLLVKTDLVIDDNQRLSLSFDLYEQLVDRPDNGEPKGDYVNLSGWTINREESAEEKKNNAYRLSYRNKAPGLAFMDDVYVNLYQNNTEQTNTFHRNHETPPPMGPGGSRDQVKSDLFEQETWGFTLSAGKRLGSGTTHSLAYGLDWDGSQSFRPRVEQRIQSDGTVTMDDLSAPFPKNETERLGIYLQDSIEIGERLTLIPGLRYDRYSMTPKEDEGYSNSVGDTGATAEKISDSNVSWRLGTIYDVSKDMSVYLQYSQGFKVPPYDLAYFFFDHVSFTGAGIRIIPAANLVPEESDSYEIGIRGAIGAFGYDLSAYRSEYAQFIQIGYVETIPEINMDFGFPFPIDVDVYQYQNIEAAEISGIEFRFDYDLSEDVVVFLNGEWMDSEDKSTGEQLAAIQPFNGTLGASWYRERVALDVMLRWVDGMDKQPEGAFTTSGYATLDLYARFAITDRLTIGAGLMNALDKEYIRYDSIAGIQDDGRDLNLYTEPGRTFSARLNFRF